MNNNFDIFKDGWESGGEETSCGYGSTLAKTEKVRYYLSKLFEYYDKDNPLTLNDIGAGDMNWIKTILNHNVDYQGYDLFPRLPNIIKLDITQEKPRTAHITLVRDLFIHFSNILVSKALHNIRHTTLWLISTTFPGSNNYDRIYEPSLKHSKIDLSSGPWFLGPPQGLIREDYPNKFLGIWELNK